MADHSKREHALFNASSADFWMECNLWVHHKMAAEAAGEVYDKSGEAARRGTLCHEAAERGLDARLDGRIVTGILGEPELTKEEIDLVETAVDASLEVINAVCGTPELVETEVAIPLSHEPESDGHVDVLAFAPRQSTRRGIQPARIVVDDHKFGEGAVSPNSYQLRVYGSNAIDKLLGLGYDLDEDDVVVLAVTQPRLHSEALTRSYTVRELIKFQHHVEHVVEAQRSRTDLRGASSLSTCDWCPFKDRCDHHRALKKNMFSKIKAKLGTDPAKLDADFVEDVVRARGAIEKLLKEMVGVVVADEARFPNWTRAQVANARKWSPLVGEEKIAEQLIAKGAVDVYGLRSPAQVRDRNKKLVKLVENLSVDQGHHVRLYEGAPKSKPVVEPPKRPANKPVRKKSKR